MAAPAPETAATAADWRALTEPYRRSDDRIAWRQLVVTVPAYGALLAAMLVSLRGPYLVTLLLALPAAGLLARIFVLFHDCGHGSLFTRERHNVVAGTLLGLLVWESFHYWRYIHAVHHATAGHLDRRGTGDYDTWTVDEYRAATRGQRLVYRVSRHPLFLFVVLPFFKFTVYNRLRLRPAPQPASRSVPLTNAALLLAYGGAALLVGWRELLLVLLPVYWLASFIGLWLFYVQHQFEQAWWARDAQWDPLSAALRGSSYYRLPAWMNWFTADIAYHHVHHLSPRIPNYRLADCHHAHPPLQAAPVITLRDSLKTLRCHLWDEAQGRMVSFASLRR